LRCLQGLRRSLTILLREGVQKKGSLQALKLGGFTEKSEMKLSVAAVGLEAVSGVEVG
jgi:hypothetical protein